MDESPVTLPYQPVPARLLSAPLPLPAWLAALQVVLVSGIPTQLFIAAALVLGTNMPFVDERGVSFQFFAMTSLIDTAAVAILIRIFLHFSGESSTDVFIGRKPVLREALLGLAMLPVVFILVTLIVLGLRAVAPWTHTVESNPFLSYMETPLEAGILILIVILSGGIREELQRAFILHRFEQRLGGIKVGLAVFTLVFGALHAIQGIDVAVAVGALGLIWGICYIRRRSAVLSMVNHAGFDTVQVLQVVLLKALGS